MASGKVGARDPGLFSSLVQGKSVRNRSARMKSRFTPCWFLIAGFLLFLHRVRRCHACIERGNFLARDVRWMDAESGRFVDEE